MIVPLLFPVLMLVTLDLQQHSSPVQIHPTGHGPINTYPLLQSINNVYNQALEHIAEPIKLRKDKLAFLKQRAQDLTSIVESPASPGHPTAIKDGLDENNDRVRYTQSILDDKIHDIALFKEKLQNRIGDQVRRFSPSS